MRNEREVLGQLLHFAQSDNRIRAVLQNGSRVNPAVTKDLFCDYDVIFAVTEPGAFLQNQEWIGHFGDIIIMQQNDLIEDGGKEGYIFMMIFTDGVRIDLSFRPASDLARHLKDSLTRVLLDKDNVIPDVAPPSERSYYTRKPTKVQFDKMTNEFWWCSTYVAKGIWRDELPYVKYMFDTIVRRCVVQMLSWHVGMHHNWQCNVGKSGKWLEKYLPPDIWTSFVRTYSGADYEETWEALLEACRLFRKVGIELAENLGYTYPIADDDKVTAYLEIIRSLPKDAHSLTD